MRKRGKLTRAIRKRREEGEEKRGRKGGLEGEEEE